MKTYIDNQLLRRVLAKEPIEFRGLYEQGPLSFGWPSFLECIDSGTLFQDFPKFDQNSLIYDFLFSSFKAEADNNLLIEIYDQIFIEALTQIKNLPQIQQQFLVEQIRKKEAELTPQAKELFSIPLKDYKMALLETPYEALHDLTLYLAWDRVCVNLATVFGRAPMGTRKHLEVLKECLVESFQHITDHGKTIPSFFRLIEALYAFEMREEHIQNHTDAEWLILCQSLPVFKSRDLLPDSYYIDKALQKVSQENETISFFTLESQTTTNAGLALADFMIKKLKVDQSTWHYHLSPLKIVHCNSF